MVKIERMYIMSLLYMQTIGDKIALNLLYFEISIYI